MVELKQNLKDLKVLIVDDHQDITEYFYQYLSRKGCDAYKALNVEEVFNLLKTHSFDVIVCDVCLPHISGLSLLRTLKTRGEIMPIVMISGYANRDMALECLTSGAYDFLYKPFRLKMLEKILEEIYLKTQRWHEHGLSRAK